LRENTENDPYPTSTSGSTNNSKKAKVLLYITVRTWEIRGEREDEDKSARRIEGIK